MKEESTMKLKKIIVFSGQIECKTGLCIKGSNSDMNIGGADSEVIKNPLTGHPYIPGSSIKGKMRSQLERKEGKFTKNDKKKFEPCGCGKTDCMICTVFGAHRNQGAESAPVRIIVRDANLSKETLDELDSKELAESNFLEVKGENVINRRTGAAESPRFIERVPAGAKFEFEILLQIFEKDKEQEKKLIEFVEEGLKAIEKSYLGGSGSRGYGEVKFTYTVKEDVI